MSVAITGYVLESIRVGQSNGPFTQTPDNYIANRVAFDAAYPTDESAPRTDYLVLVTSEGTTHPGLLESASFGWTKNEIVDRFWYDAQAGGFRALRGAAPIEAGVLALDSNENRLRVRPPAQLAPVPAAPQRLSVGSAGTGVAWSVTVVGNDAAFGNPDNLSTRAVELSLETGNLNWSTGDLTTYLGQRVRYQQQQFFTPKDSTALGTAPVLIADPVLMLNPLPGPGQLPRLRFGYGTYLTSVEVANEASFTSPSPGTVQWARDTGCLKFNASDAATNVGTAVYYDGVQFAVTLTLPAQSLGLITAPSVVIGLPPTGADLIFAVGSASPYYRFPTVTNRAAASFDATGKKGEVQVDPATGQVRFSAADRSTYAGKTVTLYFGDLPIERGISVRFLRNPVNLDGLLAIKDVTRIYSVEGATWADPIIESSQVTLPSLPIDAPAYPKIVHVVQGQGTYVSDAFPNLNVPSPPVGLGYYIDFDSGMFFFAQRKDNVLVPLQSATSYVGLPDPLLLSSNLSLEMETGPGTNVYTPLTIGDDVLVDTTSGVVALTSTNAAVASGVASVAADQLTDPQARLVSDGVQAGNLVVMFDAVYTVVAVLSETTLQLEPAPLSNGTYTIYENREVLADRYFEEVVLLDPSTKVERLRALGGASNSPRLSVPLAYVASSGFRLGAAQSSGFAAVALVPDDASFTLTAPGVVQLSEATGNLNFAAADLGGPIYWSRTLTPKADYQLQPELGLVQFTERMLSGEEARITYTVAPPSTTPPTETGAPITEYARFLIRKELTQAHPAPTSTLSFNAAGLPVAADPAPSVFRGGRPQKLGIQCTVDAPLSQITFLQDAQITDALPHGATVAPNERVYIDYYVTQAVGGEKTFTVLQTPLMTSLVMIDELDAAGQLNNVFAVPGDQTAKFPSGHLMRIETEQVFLLGSSSYDASADQTTVVLFDSGTNSGGHSQVFGDSFRDPKVYVSSGPTPITSAPQTPSYFVAELQAYESIARGSNTFLVPGDRTTQYRAGTIVLFTDSGGTDFLLTSGVAYDASTARTTVMLAANTTRQYVYGEQLLSRSVRPVFEPLLTGVQTSRIPQLTYPYLVYRQTAGQAGEVLSSPSDYTIDDTGRIVFAEALGPFEEFSICYTGLTTMSAGLNLRASYTNQITPSALNGLLGQTLLADYYIRSPDSFYFRVETMENFRGEYAAAIAASASSGSSGPQTSNASQPNLWEQGRKSLYFDERRLANQDIIARSSLLFYNDLINSLEMYRRVLDGTVVGNNDGLLLFDGVVGRTPAPGAVGNQIDDTIKVSDAPYAFTYPPYGVTSIGTYRKYYLPGALSRFYPTAKNFFGVTTSTTTALAGAAVLDTKSTDITQVSNLHARQAWGVITEYTGTDTLKLDFASGNETGFADQVQKYARKAFRTGMKCGILARTGSVVVSPVVIQTVTDFQVTVSGGLGTGAPVGSTIYQLQTDDSGYMVMHVAGRDFSFNVESGQVTYVAAAGTPPTNNTPLMGLAPYAGSITLANTLTEPFKFPALFGGVEDDDGELSFPIQTPDPNAEAVRFLGAEKRLISSASGLIRSTTTEPKISTGSVVSPNFYTITDATIGSMVPAPQPGGLVRILTGANSATGFRRIASVGSNFLIVSTTGDGGAPLPSFAASAGFTYELAVSVNIASGSASSGTVSQLTHTSASFLSTVKVGYTLVVTIGGATYRRQVSAVNSSTTVTFYPNLPVPVVALSTYRFENSLATYGNRSGSGAPDYVLEWDTALAGELALYATYQPTLQAIIAQASDGVSYFGLSGDIVTSLTALYQSIAALSTPLAPLRAKLAPATVVGFDAANTFAMGLLKSDLDARETQVTARASDITSITAQILAILANTERLYDKRYVWIDARINLENGLLVQQETVVKNRLKAQAEAIKQLTKLLAVGGT